MSQHSARSYRYTKLRKAWLWNADHGWICHLCGRKVDPDAVPMSNDSASIDHVLPTSSGYDPLDTRYWRLAHLQCNRRRQAKPLHDPPTGATRRW